MNIIASTILALTLCAGPIEKDQPVSVSKSMKDAAGFFIHEVRSPYQAETTAIKVLSVMPRRCLKLGPCGSRPGGRLHFDTVRRARAK